MAGDKQSLIYTAIVSDLGMVSRCFKQSLLGSILGFDFAATKRPKVVDLTHKKGRESDNITTWWYHVICTSLVMNAPFSCGCPIWSGCFGTERTGDELIFRRPAGDNLQGNGIIELRMRWWIVDYVPIIQFLLVILPLIISNLPNLPLERSSNFNEFTIPVNLPICIIALV